jgi:hypothetical protein
MKILFASFPSLSTPSLGDSLAGVLKILDSTGRRYWQRSGYWAYLDHAKALAAYVAATAIIDELDLAVAHATIDRVKLNASKYLKSMSAMFEVMW